MEIEGEDGSRTELEGESEAVFGRGNGFDAKDRTVSRQHVRLRLQRAGPQTEPTALFEVVGRNPVWVRRVGGGAGDEVEVFRRLERGEVAAGDWFCVSSRDPVWFKVGKKGIGSSGARTELGSELCGDLENVDVSRLHPVKEFGFLVMGHEFDCCPKQRSRDPKNWDWFVEESEGEGGGDPGSERKRKKKRGGGGNEDDEDWTDESTDDDPNIVTKTARTNGPKYSTRSRDRENGRQGSSRKKKGAGITRKVIGHHKEGEEEEEEEDDDDDDDGDELLGGFIVDDDDDGKDVVGKSDEEEEEFMDDEDEDD